MTIATAGRTQFEFGQVIEGAFGAIKRNFLIFLTLSAIFNGLPGLAYAWLTSGPTGALDVSRIWGSGALGWLLTVVTSAIVQGALVHGAFADMRHEKASFANCLRAGLNHFLPLLAIGLLTGIGLVFGFLLLIVPGIILALMWAVTAPVQVVENVGVFAAFGRSMRLTEGRRWAILGMFVLIWIISWILMFVFGVVAKAAAGALEHANYARLVAIPVGQMIGGVLNGTIGAVLYFELRRTKEGITREDLADVFD